MRSVVKRPQAKRDIMEQADYIAKDSMKSSERFLRATDKTMHQIAAMPGIGVLRDFDNPELAGMRMVPVSGFPKVGIYYLATEDTIEIVRVLHGARDIASIFAPDKSEENTEDE